MKKMAYAVFVMVLLFGSVSPARADHGAVGYWFVEISQLTDAVNRAGGLSNISPSTLNDLAECYGHFRGKTDLWLHAKTVQVRIKAEDDGKTISYSFSLWQPAKKQESVESHGTVIVNDMLSVRDEWQKGKYVLLLMRLNLKN